MEPLSGANQSSIILVGQGISVGNLFKKVFNGDLLSPIPLEVVAFPCYTCFLTPRAVFRLHTKSVGVTLLLEMTKLLQQFSEVLNLAYCVY